ncbi:MAG TPA: HNH endonuclease signature motif containing protein [Actinomycetota bacterium]
MPEGSLEGPAPPAPASEPSPPDPGALAKARAKAREAAQRLTADEERWNAVVDRLEAAEAEARGREVELRSIQAEVSGSPDIVRSVERNQEVAEGRATAARVAAGLAAGRLGAFGKRRAAERAERERAAWAERLERARVEQQELLARLKGIEAEVARARRVVELRDEEWKIREALTPKREAAMQAADRIRALEEPSAVPSTPFGYVTIARRHQVLGTLSLGEWAIRASGHGTAPRFVLEQGLETLWLVNGEWYSADSDLTAEEVMTLVRGDATADLDSRVAALVWERDGGRCVHCGALGGLEIEYVVPRALGGGDAPSNFRLLCRNCARVKAHNR